MISKKELGYVNSYAKRVPYPGYEYSRETLEHLKDSLLHFKEKYEGITYNIVFSNSEEIFFEVQEQNLAHMFGIDYKGITNEYATPFRVQALGLTEEEPISSYQLLNLIIEKADQVIQFEEDYHNLNINFYKIRVKCEIFEKLLNLMDFNFGCVNFDKKLCERQFNHPLSFNSTKLLYTTSNEPNSPYFVVGIKKPVDKITGDITDEKYLVETLLSPNDESMDQYDIKNQWLLYNQEFVIPTQILFDKNNILTKQSATGDQKMKILSMYDELQNKYQIPNKLNIYGDYLDLLYTDNKVKILK